MARSFALRSRLLGNFIGCLGSRAGETLAPLLQKETWLALGLTDPDHDLALLNKTVLRYLG